MMTYLKPFANAISSFFFPPTCQGCGERVSEWASICPKCWQTIQFITPPLCPIMGIPFQFDLGDTFLSGEALQNPPDFDRARSAVIHDGLAQHLATRLKYGDRLDLAPIMAQWMITAGQDLITDSDYIVPIPLHRWRYFKRRFNQAAELARIIADKTNLPVYNHVLYRHKQTRQQVGLSAKERQKNVKGAFNISQKHPLLIKGKNILLVDDVYTTGATVNAAARCLKKNGAKTVYVLTFSRALPHSKTNSTIEMTHIA